MPAGRPSSYDPSYCKDVISMMSEGMSKTEIAARLGIHWDTFHEWQKKHPEFSDAVKTGDKLSEAWWEEQGRIALRDKDFNATLWYMNMKNRHGWRDKQEHTGPDGAALTVVLKSYRDPESVES